MINFLSGWNIFLSGSNCNPQEKLPLSITKTPLPTTKTPLSMKHCCQSCDFLWSVAVFQFGFETLQICSTCQEQNSWAKTQSKAQHCVVQLLICLTVYTCWL